MVMPELRLSSPYPGGRAANSKNLTSLASCGDRIGTGRCWRGGVAASRDAPHDAGGAESDENAGMFEYQA